MRMSCNGCRILRKGCSENCSIRPCLQWIKSPESQAHATVFLAKFYGRAGLMNLINAGPQHLRPAVFRSLLYEACGRIVNPIYGSVGLLWSGNWQLCQNAVEAILKGNPITQIASETAEINNGPPLKAYDIRHVSKNENSTGSEGLHRVRNRCRFKKAAPKAKSPSTMVCFGSGDESCREECNRSPSHDSSLSHQSEVVMTVEGERRPEINESLASVEMAEALATLCRAAEPEYAPVDDDGAKNEKIELELTLGFEPVSRAHGVNSRLKKSDDENGGGLKMELGL